MTTHVLVIEDEPDLQELLRLNLEMRDFRVTIASDGADGLTKARTIAPDLILLDVMMPVLDGWQTLRALTSDDALAEIPVIMLTALSEERDIITGNLSGAVDYITKPFDVPDLLTRIRAALAPETAEQTAERRARTVQLLRRLAELDSGRAAGEAVRWSKLEARPEPPTAAPTIDIDLSKLETLTAKQRYVAEQLAIGRSARELAEELDVSRSNIYATRKRIGRKLGVEPESVAEAAAAMGLGEPADQAG